MKNETIKNYLKIGAFVLFSLLGTYGAKPQEKQPSRTVCIEYTIQPGDSLSKIAKRFGLKDWKVLLDYNLQHRKNPDLIYPGENLSIPIKITDQLSFYPELGKIEDDVKKLKKDVRNMKIEMEAYKQEKKPKKLKKPVIEVELQGVAGKEDHDIGGRVGLNVNDLYGEVRSGTGPMSPFEIAGGLKFKIPNGIICVGGGYGWTTAGAGKTIAQRMATLSLTRNPEGQYPFVEVGMDYNPGRLNLSGRAEYRYDQYPGFNFGEVKLRLGDEKGIFFETKRDRKHKMMGGGIFFEKNNKRVFVGMGLFPTADKETYIGGTLKINYKR